MYNPKTKTWTFYLGHGEMVAMASSPSGTASFQRLAMHSVPYLKGDKAEGWRLNLTIRTSAETIRDPLLLKNGKRYEIGEGCYVQQWTDMFTAEENEQIRECLFGTITAKGVADITKVYGKEFTNKGRKVLELACEEGFEYHYGGKTVKGIAYPELIRQLVVPKMAELYGVVCEQIWGHLVYYPTSECKLDWHDDGEDNINPHLIVSLTYLEHPNKPRAFRVRLKSNKSVTGEPRQKRLKGKK